jgi:hypothetical protein
VRARGPGAGRQAQAHPRPAGRQRRRRRRGRRRGRHARHAHGEVHAELGGGGRGLGFRRIVASEKEAPNMLADLVYEVNARQHKVTMRPRALARPAARSSTPSCGGPAARLPGPKTAQKGG